MIKECNKYIEQLKKDQKQLHFDAVQEMTWFKELAEIIPNAVMYAKVILALLEYGDSPEFVEKMREVGTANAIVMSI